MPWVKMKARATELAYAGYKVVWLDGKRPVIEGWQTLATSDTSKLGGFFNSVNPKRNLGLPLGRTNRNLVCIDIDPRNGGLDWLKGQEWLLEYCNCIEYSGRWDGGLHMFFNAPERYCASAKIGKGVDYLGDKAQVVMSPSIHPDTGLEYGIQKGSILCHDDVKPVPENIIALLEICSRSQLARERGPIDLLGKKITRNERKALSKRFDQLEKQYNGGHVTRNGSVGSWITDAMAAGMDKGEIRNACEEWLAHMKRPPNKNELENWIAYAEKHLSDGTAYIHCDAIRPERLTDKFEKKTSLNSTDSLMNSETWRHTLEVTPKFETKSSYKNCCIFLKNHSDLKGKIGTNLLAHKICKLSVMPWEDADTDYSHPIDWSDEDSAHCLLFFADDETHGTNFNRAYFFDALMVCAGENSFHPIKDWLNDLKWDNKPRLDDWLHRVTGCEDYEYTRLVSKYLIMSMVTRIMNPGVKCDNVVILESVVQGVGKSTLGQILAGTEYFCGDLGDIKSKQAIENSLGHWLIELSEIDKMMCNSNISTMKSFISTAIDVTRLAYGRHAKRIKRQSIMLGTTNKTEYLYDSTGNRRYFPIRCSDSKFKLNWLIDNRDQLFAEALALISKGESFVPSNHFEHLALGEQAKRVVTDAWEKLIGAYAQSVPQGVNVDMILEDCLGIIPSRVKNKDRGRIKRCFKLLNLYEFYDKKSNTKLWKAKKS